MERRGFAERGNALDQAAALQDWGLPQAFRHLRHLLEAIPMVVTFAVNEAIHIGAIGSDAVKQIALARIERRPARHHRKRRSGSTLIVLS